jgi:L-threonylcarbamoyladenylate synthase
VTWPESSGWSSAVGEVVSLSEPSNARAALERTISSGGVAVFPADGLYGLACDPLRADAIARLHALKGRDDGKPSAVLFFSPLILRELVGSLGDPTRQALGALLPGPVTLVVHNPEHRYPLACREDPKRLGIRLIESPLSGVATPLFQTSANLAGEPAPSRFSDIPAGLIEAADLAIDGGELTGAPSTVVDVTGLETGGGWKILREGGMPEAEVAHRLGVPGTTPGARHA